MIGKVFAFYDAIAVGPNGHIVIDTEQELNSAPRPIVIVWNWDTRQWDELTGAAGIPAESLLSGVNENGEAVILANGNVYLAKAGFTNRLDSALPGALVGSQLNWTPYNGSVNNGSGAALQYTRPTDDGEAAGVVIWTGAELRLAADTGLGLPASNMHRIRTVTGPEADRPGQSGMFNDQARLVFHVSTLGPDATAGTADDPEAIYVAQPK
jgi:hypothetical protein